MFSLLSSLLRNVYDILFLYPMLYFYEQGHWKGLERDAICATLQNFDATFWRDNPHACDAIIRRQVHSNVVTVITASYAILLLYSASLLIRHSAKRLFAPRTPPATVYLCETPRQTLGAPLYDLSSHTSAESLQLVCSSGTYTPRLRKGASSSLATL